LASLQKTGEIQKLVRDVGAVYIDEIHHAGSASYTNLLPEIDHVYYRYGFTGTFLRNDSKSLDMWGFLSNVLYKYSATRAIADGFLTPVEVTVHDVMGKPSRSYPKEYDNNYCGSEGILRKVLEICHSAGDNEQILILVKNKDKAGAIFHDFLKTHGFDNAYISGDDKKDVVNSTIKAFNDKRVRILIGSSVIGEGIDVRSTDHLIMCQGGKSEIVIVQAAGRAVRLFEGKRVARIHDFNFLRTKYMQKHLLLRKDIYKRNFECPIYSIAA
jgi:superfamily II DNA or RNA helicase